MTLIITELSQFGIAMVADRAVTFTERLDKGRTVSHVLNGANKLYVIPSLGAGISVWGLGDIRTSGGRVSTDVWLADFIERQTSISTIDEFAAVLAQDLQRLVGPVREPVGFHLAGYVDQDGKRLPTFYHIRNVDGTFQGYTFHDFIKGNDFGPRELFGGQTYITRNGSYGPYAILVEKVNEALPIIEEAIGLTIPYPSLTNRLAYHAAWLKFISDLYHSASLQRTIGGGVSALAINPTGGHEFYPNL